VAVLHSDHGGGTFGTANVTNGVVTCADLAMNTEKATLTFGVVFDCTEAPQNAFEHERLRPTRLCGAHDGLEDIRGFS
jgi:hypothetical protein